MGLNKINKGFENWTLVEQTIQGSVTEAPHNIEFCLVNVKETYPVYTFMWPSR